MNETEQKPQPDPPPDFTPRPGHPYAWIGYFVFLLVTSIGVTVFMIQFNRNIQLKPEQLEAAHNLWKAKGPKSYNMIYTKKLGASEHGDRFVVKVRNGHVDEVKMNDKALVATVIDGQKHDPRIYHSMDNIYRDVMKFMDMDQKPGATKVYVVANVDEKTGALLRYIRRVMGSTDRIELNIALEPVEGD